MRDRQVPPQRAGGLGELLTSSRFTMPAHSHTHARRPRLLHALDADDGTPLVLVSAPAGAGKSTVVAEWVRHRRSHDRTSGWVTFEAGERDLWTQLGECLRRIGAPAPGPGPARRSGRLGTERVAALAEAFAGSPQRWTVVVDGYELVSLDLAREVDYLLHHSGGHLRLVMVSRVDPVLPLHRYRLDGELLELRIADLAFTDDEAAALLAAMGVRLGAAALHELNSRLGGWAAGLRFAGRALERRADADDAVTAVLSQAGDLSEYLLVEVLDAQTPALRRLMLDASVPEVLTPDLTDALLGSEVARPLAELARANAFIEPLTDGPGAYRYLPFFRDVLRSQLAYESPLRAADLHVRTADWLRHHGLVEQAVGHLVAAGRWGELAQVLVDGVVLGRLPLEGGEAGVLQVGREIPDDCTDPAAHLVRAAVALSLGEWSECVEELARLESSPDARHGAHAAAWLGGAVLDAVRSAMADEVSRAGRRCAAARGRLADVPPYLLGAAIVPTLRFAEGVVSLRRGQLEGARAAFVEAVESPLGSSPMFRGAGLAYLALVDSWRGQLTSAEQAATESLALTAGRDGAGPGCPPVAHLALARVALERYQLPLAGEHLAAAASCRTLPLDRFLSALSEGVRAGVERAEGRLAQARARFDAAAAACSASDPWAAGSLRVESAAVSVADGHATQALRQLDEVTACRPEERAVVAAAAYAQRGDDADAEAALARVRESGPPTRAEVMVLLVEAGHESRRHGPQRAREVLDRSLRIAERERLRRPFREAAPEVQRVLRSEPRLMRAHGWLNQTSTSSDTRDVGSRHEVASPPPRPDLAVVLPLTAKELEVLGHLDALLTTEEIGAKMFVSVNTVRTHIRSILRKLGVTRRNAAVRKARELGLLGS